MTAFRDSRRGEATSLWPRSDLVVTAAVTLVASLCVAVAWVGSSGKVQVTDQFVWLNFALVGVVIATAGDAVWIMRGRRAVGLRMRALFPDGPSEEGQAAGDLQQQELVYLSGPDMTRYHEPGCLLIEGKAVTTATPLVHRNAGRRPCEMCHPS